MANGRVKGTIFMQTVKYIRAAKERGRALVPEHLERYLEGRILASSWYPEGDHLELMRVSTELFGGPGSAALPKTWEQIARATAPVYFEGAYRPLVHKGGPERTLSSFRSLWELRHDTGDVGVERVAARESSVTIAGYALVSEHMCASIGGMFLGLLDAAEATNASVTHPRCTAKGDANCEWRLRWD